MNKWLMKSLNMKTPNLNLSLTLKIYNFTTNYSKYWKISSYPSLIKEKSPGQPMISWSNISISKRNHWMRTKELKSPHMKRLRGTASRTEKRFTENPSSWSWLRTFLSKRNSISQYPSLSKHYFNLSKGIRTTTILK